MGQAYFLDAGTQNYMAATGWWSTTTISPQRLDASGTNLTLQGINSTAPFTWTTNDRIIMEFEYEAA
jgi:hypothetical protein